MEARGQLIDIAFDFDVELGNSIGSLRLLWWVKSEYGFAKQEALAGKLAQWHFEEKRCVSRKETLLGACTDLGISVDKAEQVIDSTAYMAGTLAPARVAHAEVHC
jgi:predicted DsbA family dithiol-disulfide isomerase